MIQISPNFKEEKNLHKKGYEIIAGLDEVGRGCLAGPIVAAAVIFKDYDKVIRKLKSIKDSKIINPKQREELDLVIKDNSFDFSYGFVEVNEINEFGIGAANILAFKRALDNLDSCDFALIDGRKFRGFEYNYKCIEKGESISISIAAASIIAKVYRDSLMGQYAIDCPRYGFGKNKGYGSSRHLEALKEYGPSEFHRKDFLKKFSNKQSQRRLLEFI